MSLIIALDFDDTYTADPVLWSEFVKNAQKRGHYMMVVTYRMESYGSADIEAALPGVEIVMTGGKKKRQMLRDAGYPEPSIWIDDMPELIV